MFRYPISWEHVSLLDTEPFWAFCWFKLNLISQTPVPLSSKVLRTSVSQKPKAFDAQFDLLRASVSPESNTWPNEPYEVSAPANQIVRCVIMGLLWTAKTIFDLIWALEQIMVKNLDSFMKSYNPTRAIVWERSWFSMILFI